MDAKQKREYDELIAAGQSESIAEILATQTCPGMQTDKRFMSGRGENSYYSHQLQQNVSSRADVKRICAEKNYDCEGSVSHKAYWDKPREDEEKYEVAEDIVHDACLDILEENPTALLDDHDLINKTRDRLTGDM